MPSKELIEIIALDVVIEVFDEEDAICSRRKLCLSSVYISRANVKRREENLPLAVAATWSSARKLLSCTVYEFLV